MTKALEITNKSPYPMFHTCSISDQHARKIAELNFSNDFIRIFVSADTRDNSFDVGARIHCLLGAILHSILALQKREKLSKLELSKLDTRK
jgi:hypothetical protein